MTMNLHAIAAPFAAVVTGATLALWRESTGYTDGPGAKRVPSYTDHPDTDVRVQAMSSGDLQLLDSMNIQGVKRIVFASAALKAVDRAAGKGGDLLVFGGATWLVAAMLEEWDQSGWCKVALTKQLDPPA